MQLKNNYWKKCNVCYVYVLINLWKWKSSIKIEILFKKNNLMRNGIFCYANYDFIIYALC